MKRTIKSISAFLWLILISHVAMSQTKNRCGFHQMDSIFQQTCSHDGIEKRIRSRQSRKQEVENNLFTIPIVFHIVHFNNTNQIGIANNIIDEQVFSAVQVLNEDFRRLNEDTVGTPEWAKSFAADIKIDFCLATQDPEGNPTNGITRHRGSKPIWEFTQADDIELKSFGYWPSDEYLNVWVAEIEDGILGYAQFPDSSSLAGLGVRNGSNPRGSNELTDGVVISPEVTGRLVGLASNPNNPYNLGRTLTHEVGHWLGLLHIHSENGSCEYTDFCDDTPTQDFGSLGFNDCGASLFTDCGTEALYQNYMDITDDACMNLFTLSQKERMRIVLEESPRRRALRFSKGCCGSNSSIEIPYEQGFSSPTEAINELSFFTSDSSSLNWELDNNELSVDFINTTTTDSLYFLTGIFEIDRNTDLKFRFNLNSEGPIDSLHIIYEIACSEEFTVFRTIRADELVVGANDLIFSINESLQREGLIRLGVVLYNNGIPTTIDNVSIYEETEELMVAVFPVDLSFNQFNFITTFTGDQDLTIAVYNLNGKVVLNRKLEDVHSDNFILDVGNLKRGFYLVRIVTEDNQSLTAKFVIDR